MDLRVRVLADYDAGMGTQALAEKYRVSTEWVRSLRRLREETGQIAPRRGKPGPKPRLAEHSEQVTKLVEEQPDATLEELQEQLGVSASISTIWRALKALGLTLKKSPACGRTGSP
jgi:transposase